MRLKILFVLFLNISLTAICPIFAQEGIPDVTLEYGITVTSAAHPVPPGLEGATLTIFLKPFESRTEFRNAAGMETTIFDEKKGRGAILKEYSGQKLMITLGRENWEQKREMFRSLIFSEQQSAELLSGFSVRLASSVLPGGKKLTVYYTPDVKLQNNGYGYAFPQLGGLPVKFEISSDELTFTYQLINLLTEPLPPSKFLIPQNGFRIMSYEDNLKLNLEK